MNCNISRITRTHSHGVQAGRTTFSIASSMDSTAQILDIGPFENSTAAHCEFVIEVIDWEEWKGADSILLEHAYDVRACLRSHMAYVRFVGLVPVFSQVNAKDRNPLLLRHFAPVEERKQSNEAEQGPEDKELFC